MRALLASCVASTLALGACEPERFKAHEDWSETPELRIVVVLRASERRVFVVPGEEAFDLSLADAFDLGEASDVWVHRYRLSTLAQAFPGLRGMAAQAVAKALEPSLGAAEGTVLAPPSEEVLLATIAPGAAPLIGYQHRSFDDWIRATPEPLSFRIPSDVICRGFSLMRFDGPEGVRLTAAAVTASGRAIFGGESARADPAMRLFALDRGETELSELPRGPEMRGVSASLARDPLDDTIVGASGDGRLFRVDENGTRMAIRQLEPRARGVGVGTDGAVIAYPGRPYSNYYELAQDSWVRRPGVEFPIELLAVVRTDLVAAFSNCWVFEDNGQVVRRRLLDPNCDTRTGEGNTLLGLATDEAGGMVAVGRGSFVAIRDVSLDGEPWRRDDTLPVERTDLRVAAALGWGRHVVGGEGGVLAAFKNPGWCVFETGEPKIDFLAAAASPDRKFFVAAGTRTSSSAGGTRAVVVRVSIPPPDAL